MSDSFERSLEKASLASLLPKDEENLTIEEWAEEYDLLIKNPPMDGDYLRTEDGSRIRLKIELVQGQLPFVYTHVYIPEIVGSKLGWFARGETDTDESGWKTILLPRACSAAIKRLGVSKSIIYVRELRVVRPSPSNKSLLVEITEW